MTNVQIAFTEQNVYCMLYGTVQTEYFMKVFLLYN